MIFDQYGLPRCTHADDFADSSMLAGMMNLVFHPQAPNLNSYFKFGKPVRHPFERTYPENEPRCMSRDQMVCLYAGALGRASYYDRYFAPNDMDEKTGKWKTPDWLSPSVRNHFKLCAGREGSALGFLWLEMDIWYNGKYTPLREQNQIQAMVLTAGKEYVQKYVRANSQWEVATRLYWNDTRPGHYNRGEPELAEMIINKIKSRL